MAVNLEEVPAVSAPSAHDVEDDHLNGNEREKLTGDGSLDRFGRPARIGETGGWPSAMLLLVNQGLATSAFVAVEVNLVLFSTRVLNQDNAEASNNFSKFMGTVNLFALFGAFVSDAYLGRYMTCIIFQPLLALGMAMLSVTTSYLLLKPEGCGKQDFPCGRHSSFEMAMFYLSIYLLAFGNGASEPSIATFGSDQFDDENAKEKAAKETFYSYFYVATNIGNLFSETFLVYLQNLGHWTLGFWVATASALLAVAIFFSGTTRYRHFKKCGNPISRFSLVVVAAWKKKGVELPLQENGLYEVHETNGARHGGRKILHTKGFRFLDHAAIITSRDAIPSLEQAAQINPNPWQLCTITQVEEVKCVLRLLPIWLCTILFSGIFFQMHSLFVEQGASMRTTISNFHIPPASMTSFDIVAVSAFIIIYNKFLSPLYTKLTNTIPKGPSDLTKIGIGLVLAIAAMVNAGIIEIQRKNHAENGKSELSSLGILWQAPQYILLGVAEAFVYVGQLDFFGSQTPDGLKSMGIALSLSSTSLGSYLCSLILTVVMKITTTEGRSGWIPPNLNDGHMERFFFLMAALTAVELVIYILCTKRYKCISLERRDANEIVHVVP